MALHACFAQRPDKAINVSFPSNGGLVHLPPLHITILLAPERTVHVESARHRSSHSEDRVVTTAHVTWTPVPREGSVRRQRWLAVRVRSQVFGICQQELWSADDGFSETGVFLTVKQLLCMRLASLEYDEAEQISVFGRKFRAVDLNHGLRERRRIPLVAGTDVELLGRKALARFDQVFIGEHEDANVKQQRGQAALLLVLIVEVIEVVEHSIYDIRVVFWKVDDVLPRLLQRRQRVKLLDERTNGVP